MIGVHCSERDLASLAGEGSIFGGSAAAKLERLRAEIEPLSCRYDVVVANPPYMGSSNMNGWVSKWVKKNYPIAKSDLCTCFFNRAQRLAGADGYISMITASSWMFISSFEKFRKQLLSEGSICSMIQQSTHGYAGVTVPTTMFAYACRRLGVIGSYIRLEDFDRPQWQEPRALEALADPGCGWFYRADADRFGAIPGSPIAYWLPFQATEAFLNGISIDGVSDYTGSPNITGDNDKYLRFVWEIGDRNLGNRWKPYSKGGDFRRWYGNLIHVVDWSEQARCFYERNKTSTLLPEKYWFRGGITYTMLTSGKACFRHIGNGCIWDKSGPVICLTKQMQGPWLAFLNSSIAQLYLDTLNPTMNLQVRDVKALPFLPVPDEASVSEIVGDNILFVKIDWDAFEISADFKRHPLI